MIWIIWMGEGDDHLLPIMQTEKPLVGKIALVNFILQMIWMDRTVPKRTAPCCNHFCQLYWSSRRKSLLLAGLSRATMFCKWSGQTERVGLLQRAWSGTTIFFVFSWPFRRKYFLLSHYQTQEWNGVFEGVQTLSSKGWMAAMRQYMGTCLGILAAVALVGTLTQLYTEKK